MALSEHMFVHRACQGTMLYSVQGRCISQLIRDITRDIQGENGYIYILIFHLYIYIYMCVNIENGYIYGTYVHVENGYVRFYTCKCIIVQ